MSRILSIKRLNIINEKLYNLAVEEDESYIANNIVVHNCRSLFSSVFRGDEYEANWGTKSQNDKIKQEAYSSPATGFGGVGRVTIPKSLEEVN